MNLAPDKNNLSSAVLTQIEVEKIAPHSRYFFLSREYGLWFLWLLAGVFGSLAVAMTLFTLKYRLFDAYEFLDDSLVYYLLRVLPYLWFVALFLMLVIAVYDIRHTNRGYRYPLWVVLLSSLVFSLCGGAILHAVGLGFVIDEKLGTYFEVYDSQNKVEKRLWHSPETGRLIGQSMSVDTGNSIAEFGDVDQKQWQVVVSELPLSDVELLQSGEKVRLIGQLVSNEPPIFHACGVMLLMSGRDYEQNELGRNKKDMQKRMLLHHNSHQSDELSLCAEAGFMRKLKLKPSE